MQLIKLILTHPILHILTLRLVSAATTVGPLAPVSINQLPSYSTARPCAAGCLVYNGLWACEVNAGYHDLGKDLGCGCAPNNACFCSAGLASGASSYISSCVSAKCSSFGDVGGDLTSMLGLYQGYCQTANTGSPSSVPAATTAEGTQKSTGVATVTTAKSTGSVPATTSASTMATSPQETTRVEDAEDEGLSKSDIIALATGLGIGIPSLLVGAVALFQQLRRRAPKSPASSVTETHSQTGSQTHQIGHFQQPIMTPYQPPVYELGSQRNV